MRRTSVGHVRTRRHATARSYAPLRLRAEGTRLSETAGGQCWPRTLGGAVTGFVARAGSISAVGDAVSRWHRIRRRFAESSPARGFLLEKLRSVLAAAGPPCVEPDAERRRSRR